MITLLLVLFSLLAHAGTTDRFATGDAAFRNRADAGNARQALVLYRESYKREPDAASAWRVSMACYFLGFHLKSEPSQKRELFAEGRDAGVAGVGREEPCVACHFWAAVNMALYGNEVGAFKMLTTLTELRAHLHRSLELDPSFAYGGAYRLLGLIEQKLPGILGGNNRRARDYFEKAIAIAPDEPLNYMFMAKLLHDEFNDKTAAREFARRGKDLAAPALERVESIEAQTELQAIFNAEGEQFGQR